MHYRSPVVIWLLLLTLLGISLLSVAFISGTVQYVISLSCAIAIAASILITYMRLRLADGLLRTFALGGLVWLSFLLLMSMLDVMGRQQL